MTPNGTATRATAVAVVIAASVLLTGCVSTVSGSAVRAQNAGPVDAPKLEESKLDDVLLSVDEINGIMGATDMTVTDEFQEMTPDTAELSDPACVGALFGAMESVYDGSGWTAVVDQIASEDVDDNAHWVEQAAVLYPSADKAREFFDDSRSAWEGCANSAISVDESGSTYLWRLDGVTAEDTLLTQMTTQEDADGWGCQHALSVVSNAIIEAWACSYAIADEATTIATDMVAKVAEK